MIRLNDPEAPVDDEDEQDEVRSPYQWCLHCERAYARGEHRMRHGLRMCPYDGCDGDTFMDGWDWDRFRAPLPQYPAIPEFGVKYPMYPEDYPVLSKDAEKLLNFLVSEIRSGRFDPAKDKTLCSYKEVHDTLSLPRLSGRWDSSLNSQGFNLLSLWARTHKLPAITGLVVKSTKPRLPEDGFFKTFRVVEQKEDWWRAQIREALSFDWSPWLAPATEKPLE
jgi:hypothetical protein